LTHCATAKPRTQKARAEPPFTRANWAAAHIVDRRHRAYVMVVNAGLAAGARMSDTATAATSRSSRLLWVLAAAGGLLLGGTLALWAHYGTAVFYEMILAGIALCL
jgi:hypothetical protein